jgi:FdhE protein
MRPVETGVQALERRHPEWKPWLAVIQEVLVETVNREWELVVPVRSERQHGKIPLLADTIVRLDELLVGRLLDRLLRIACRSGSSKLATLEAARRAGFDPLALFEAALYEQTDQLEQEAALLHADPEALQAIAALLPIPFLHACNRRWAALKSESWIEGYCPTCAAWPTFSEVRGIERTRYFRCGRCGGEWQANCLFCPYCGMTDHRELASLVPEKSGVGGVVDACKRCLGYVKAFTRLQAAPPARILVDDLATVDFDIAALERGYTRPKGAGYQLNSTVTPNAARHVPCLIP